MISRKFTDGRIARQIQEELVKDYTAKEALADWWSREDSAGPSLPKKINPRNVRNKDKVQELEEEIKRYEATTFFFF
jgi:kinetochore protein Mis13/DSN1